MMQYLISFLLIVPVMGWDNGLARTPPMGWLSWERFRCNIDCQNDPANCISERLYKDMADRMASDGYKEAGYEYVNIDDCWMSKQRDANGDLVADPDRFPSGIKALADYVHAKGLKLGIYEDFGTKTCGGYPGSEGYLEQDARKFASWGIDSLKLDGCYSKIQDMPAGYTNMSRALTNSGRPILYSCSWPAYWTGSNIVPDYKAIAAVCNLWRNYGDVQDSWDSVASIINFYAKDEGNFSSVAGPGAWNDPDMLIVGDFGLSYGQQRAQMIMWSMLAAPLYMSADLRSISDVSKGLLLNRNLLAVNQDKLGRQARRVSQSKVKGVEVWHRELSSGEAVAVLNTRTDGTPYKFSSTLKDMGALHDKVYKVTDGFDGKSLGSFDSSASFSTIVNPSGSANLFILQ